MSDPYGYDGGVIDLHLEEGFERRKKEAKKMLADGISKKDVMDKLNLRPETINELLKT